MSAAGMPDVRAVLFDKDGTLFDFARTWNAWSLEVLNHLSGGDEALADALARAIMFDRQAVTFLPGSPAIAGTNDMVARALASELPGADAGQIARFLADSAAGAPLAEAVPLVPLLAQLAARDMALGVMTNDHESSARAHLSASGVLEMFDFVAGADSGYGAKPDPDPLLAFCDAVGARPGATVMVGDSTHDLVAGRAAGMRTVGVLTGMSGVAELAPFADVVLPDIGHLPGWLGGV
ncbi:HAD family hydrolase [Marinibacterium sp. SX1]|uniref:HAD family hydrolase n=1 Tax=Marinibacterium sp. SX1 TaxID=3388424 RepID=UPI003D182ED7